MENSRQVFFAQIRAKILHCKTQFQNTNKGSLSLNEYLFKIKNYVDMLTAIRYYLSSNDHIEAIFNGLTKEYGTFIVSILSRIGEYIIVEREYIFTACSRSTN